MKRDFVKVRNLSAVHHLNVSRVVPGFQLPSHSHVLVRLKRHFVRAFCGFFARVFFAAARACPVVHGQQLMRSRFFFRNDFPDNRHQTDRFPSQ
jgi:hypothetical protein